MGQPADRGFTNRLVNETSPYLLQHAHNPVEWYPWGPEALAAAKEQNRPIFLSIGYSACHWCHVMEKESFEDPATAAVMNEHFINIKVDREERPDLDSIYMRAVQLMTQHGGWPMSVWLTPDLEPFYGGTYFPPVRRHGLPSFTDVLQGLSDAWEKRREEIFASASDVVKHIAAMESLTAASDLPPKNVAEVAARELQKYFDPNFGGIGRAPKFPHAVEMRMMLRAAMPEGDAESTDAKAGYREIVLFSLEKMIRGGIYDQLGGGFHRYSTDQRWLVPHFEKMLYDNALIPLAMLDAYQITQNPLFERATRETLDWVLREMTSSEGGFYSTLDADSEGVEGKFYVWSRQEVLEILGAEAGERFAYCYDVSETGNWEESNILNLPRPVEQCASMLGLAPAALADELAASRDRLLAVRAKRIWPGRDEKILTAWNGMMIEAFAVAARVLREPRYQQAAVAGAEFLWSKLRADDGRLLRTYKDGKAKLNAYLEDYSYFASALLAVYEATFDPKWIDRCETLTQRMVEQFWDEAEGGFFFTSNDHEKLISRAKDPSDGAIPSGNSMAATVLARLHVLTGKGDHADRLETMLRVFRGLMTDSAMQGAQLILAADFYLNDPVGFAIVSPTQPELAGTVAEELSAGYLPRKVMAGQTASATGSDGPKTSSVPLLDEKVEKEGEPTLFVCRGTVCGEPWVGLDKIRSNIEGFGKNG